MNTLALSLLFVIGFSGDACAQGPLPDEGQDAQAYRISVNVHLVVLNTMVRDRKGSFVSGLHEPDFAVYEDGVRQTIRLFQHEDIPVTVGLVIDHSGSMQRKIPEVIAAARTFVRFSNPDDEMFVVNFNERVTLGLPDAIRFTNRPDELQSAILRAPAAGQTALYDAVIEALDRLQSGARDKKVLVVISDGGDNVSANVLSQVLKKAEQSSALVYTIGIFDDEDPDRNPAVLRRLAGATGGEAFFPGQLHEVVAICERIARDIRHQYAIGYVSSSVERPGAFRKVRVAAATKAYGKLFVRARTGYIAADPDPVLSEAAK